MLKKAILLAGLCGLLSAQAMAAYPAKSVSIVVPFPPGQTGDIIARVVSEQLSKRLNETFIVINKAGAGGTIGTNFAAHAKGDGYTLLLTSTGPFSIAPALYSQLPYSPLKDFEPVVEVATAPQVLLTGSKSSFNSLDSFLKEAKSADMTFASSGNGSTQHLTMEIFKKAAGIKLLHVPFKGSAEADTQVIGGLIPIMFDTLSAVLPHIEAGKLKALAVADSERSPYLPQVKSLAELGYPSVRGVAFFALMAPKGTPKEIVDLLNSTVNDFMKTPEMKEQFKRLALTPAKVRSSGEFTAYLQSEATKWAQAVKDAGAQIN